MIPIVAKSLRIAALLSFTAFESVRESYAGLGRPR